MEAQNSPIMVHRDHWTPEHMALLCGIANAGGGTLVVESTNKVFTAGRRKMRRPFEEIPKLVEKELGIECSTEPVLDGSVLCLEIVVPAAPKPIAYDGAYWLFIDDYNTRSTYRDVESALNGEGRVSSNKSDAWELQPQPNARIGGLNTEAFLALATLKTESANMATDSLGGTLMRRMEDMGLVGPRRDELTNASVLLLHNNPKKYISGASVQMKLLSSDGREMLSNEVNGALVHQLNESLRLLFEQYLPMGMVASGSPPNEQSFALNLPSREAVRDALLMALAHRDYTQDEPIQIVVDPKWLTIIHPINMNTGDAAENNDELHSPSSANPLLTRALQTLGVMEEKDVHHDGITGRCLAAGLPAPLFEQHRDGTRTMFSLDPNKGPQQSTVASAKSNPTDELADTQSRQENVTQTQAGNTPKESSFATRSIAAAQGLDLTSTDEYVLRVLNSNGRATAPRIATVLGVSESTVRRAFRKLREHGLIERIGSDKAGYWRVNI